jgi:PKD repeat protein
MSTQLKIDSVIWDFGDETTSTDLETSHIYQNTGTIQSR